MSAEREAERIRRVYQRREGELPADYYSLAREGVLFAHTQRARASLRMLRRADMLPLEGRRIVDVGCGTGDQLAELELWGARREDLAGIDLLPDRVARASARLPGADLRVGNAASLPWSDAAFDLAVQSTAFTSILDPEVRRLVAAEMARVLRPGGAVLWYDFSYDNPFNPNVRGVRAEEIRALFPGFAVDLERVTLASPLARRLAPLSWTATLLLEKLRVLNTHYLGVFRRP